MLPGKADSAVNLNVAFGREDRGIEGSGRCQKTVDLVRCGRGARGQHLTARGFYRNEHVCQRVRDRLKTTDSSPELLAFTRPPHPGGKCLRTYADRIRRDGQQRAAPRPV